MKKQIYEKQATSYKLLATSYTLLATRYSLLATRYSLQKLNTKFLVLLALFYSGLFFGQSNILGVGIAWDAEVGCQVYAQDDVEHCKNILIENIEDGKCIRVCEKSTVNYTLSITSSTNFSTQWNVAGGIILNQTDNSCTVAWGDFGSGTINTTGYAKGVYVIVLKENNINILQQKLIIE